MRFHDQVAIVTGGGQGMGAAVAKGLAAEGASVVIADINPETGNRTAHEITAAGGKSHYLGVDITNRSEVARLFKESTETFGALDILVNNAGISAPSALVDVTETDYDRVMALNVRALFFCTQEAARVMIPRRSGKIVNFASMTGFVSSSTPNNAYDTSKGAVRQFTVVSAAELAPYGINVNAVAPGTILTDLTRRVLDTPEKMANVAARIPFGRMGQIDEVAKPVLFLCSSDASYITGHTLVIDGGRLLY